MHTMDRWELLKPYLERRKVNEKQNSIHLDFFRGHTHFSDESNGYKFSKLEKEISKMRGRTFSVFGNLPEIEFLFKKMMPYGRRKKKISTGISTKYRTNEYLEICGKICELTSYKYM